MDKEQRHVDGIQKTFPWLAGPGQVLGVIANLTTALPVALMVPYLGSFKIPFLLVGQRQLGLTKYSVCSSTVPALQQLSKAVRLIPSFLADMDASCSVQMVQLQDRILTDFMLQDPC